jgi:hypothetical protein
MPSDSYASPSLSGFAPLYKARTRNWTNTVNYHTVPKSSLVTKSYYDYKRTAISQGLHEAYSLDVNGTKSQTQALGYRYQGTQIEELKNSAFLESGFTAHATKVYNDAMVKLLAKVADAKANLGVTLAEARKTSSMILSIAQRVSNAYRAFRRGRFADVARYLNLTPKTVHKTWLEYKYGWMPLLMEVKGAAEFFAQQVLGGRPPRFSVKERGIGPFNWGKTSSFVPYGGGALAYSYTSLAGKYECTIKLWCEVTNPHFSALQQLGLTNPLLVAWELVPFSFVFDWFISVGNWLVGLTAMDGITVRNSLSSNVNDLRFRYLVPQTVRTSGTWTYVNGQYDINHVSREYARNTFTVNPGSLTPPVQLDFSFGRLVTALALLKAVHR